MSENIQLNEGFTVVCVWPGTIVGSENVKDFTEWFRDEFGVRVQYLEEINTFPSLIDNVPVRGTGNRNDAFFAIHKEDISKFAIPKINIGARWLEDVYFNDQGDLYPERVKEYLGTSKPTPSEQDLTVTYEMTNE